MGEIIANPGAVASLSNKITTPERESIKVSNVEKVSFHKIGSFVVVRFDGYEISGGTVNNFASADFRPEKNFSFFVLLFKSDSDNYIGYCNITDAGALIISKKDSISSRSSSNLSGYKLYGSTIWSIK